MLYEIEGYRLEDMSCLKNMGAEGDKIIKIVKEILMKIEENIHEINGSDTYYVAEEDESLTVHFRPTYKSLMRLSGVEGDVKSYKENGFYYIILGKGKIWAREAEEKFHEVLDKEGLRIAIDIDRIKGNDWEVLVYGYEDIEDSEKLIGKVELAKYAKKLKKYGVGELGFEDMHISIGDLMGEM